MNKLTSINPLTSVGITIVDKHAELHQFLMPESAAAIWNRYMPETLLDWLKNLDPILLPKGRVTLPSGNIEHVVTQLCNISGLPRGPKRDWLISEIKLFADIFTQLIPSKYLKLRLDVVTGNACRKFHIDAITARMVCTYRGTGTQYGFADNGHAPDRIFTVPTGSPIFLRGTKWPAESSAPLLHRSPPIEGTGEPRLVLVLDQASDPNEIL